MSEEQKHVSRARIDRFLIVACGYIRLQVEAAKLISDYETEVMDIPPEFDPSSPSHSRLRTTFQGLFDGFILKEPTITAADKKYIADRFNKEMELAYSTLFERVPPHEACIEFHDDTPPLLEKDA